MGLIGIGISDIHNNEWNQYNSDGKRTQYGFESMISVSKIAKDKKVPVFFPGDLFHNDTYLTQAMFEGILRTLSDIRELGVDWYCIDGNHDQSSNNYLDEPSMNWVKSLSLAFPNFKYVSFNPNEVNKDLVVTGIPYITGNRDYKKAVKKAKKPLKGLGSSVYKVLLVHTALWGAEEPDGTIRTEVQNIPKTMHKLYKDFDLVISGHIHKPQKLSSFVYMLGAPMHQRKSDKGCEMGYWEIYDDKEPQFVPFNFPQFVESEEDDGKNYWIKPVEKKDENEEEEEAEVTSKTDREVIAKKYCKSQGVKSKKKVKLLTQVLKSVE